MSSPANIRGYIGLDTSNYTTSAAFVTEGGEYRNVSVPLTVEPGSIGLRQSDAVFQHVKKLPDVVGELFELFEKTGAQVAGFAASSRPRTAEGSYMPCFLPGAGTAAAMAASHRLPLKEFSHQDGHIAAALFSAGRMELAHKPFLSWHMSGGTTELLEVSPAGNGFSVTIVGGSDDISFGQAIDRAGVMLGLPFPCGGALEELALRGEPGGSAFRVENSRFSISGLENRFRALREGGESPERVARFVFDSLTGLAVKATSQARKRFGELPLLVTGGVASSRLMREALSRRFAAVFGAPEYSRDNALGIAALCMINAGGGEDNG